MLNKSSCLIVIPAYNEQASIRAVVQGAKKYADVCVINDNSTDATRDILQSIPDIHVINHTENTHIPGGLLDGMRYAVEKGYDYAVSMDAGLSHNPEEIPLFLAYPPCDLVIGCRERKINTPRYRLLLSKAGNISYNIFLDFPESIFRNKYYRDITSGFRRYSYDAMELLLSREMKSKSFDILFETAKHIYQNRMSIAEVPITYNFSNSSLNWRVFFDCLKICFKG